MIKCSFNSKCSAETSFDCFNCQKLLKKYPYLRKLKRIQKSLFNPTHLIGEEDEQEDRDR